MSRREGISFTPTLLILLLSEIFIKTPVNPLLFKFLKIHTVAKDFICRPSKRFQYSIGLLLSIQTSAVFGGSF